MHELLSVLTILGDSRLLLGAAGILIIFGSFSRTNWTYRWLIAVACVCVITLATKLAFLGWGIGIHALEFTGISGHAAVSASVWPPLLRAVAKDSLGRRVWKTGLTSLGFLLAASIAWSRLPLNAHSLSEVTLGWLLGATASVFVIRQQRQEAMFLGAPLVALFGSALFVAILPIPKTHQVVVDLAEMLSGSDSPRTRNSTHAPPIEDRHRNPTD